MRLLHVRYRNVTPDAIAAYSAAWKAVQQATSSAGGHAWAFNGVDDAGVFLEFIELKQLHNELPPAIATAADALENIAASRDAGTWKEWTN